MPQTMLENRALIDVSGPEAGDFLQGIITTDVNAIGQGEAWPGALLTPQGKIMFEFMIARAGDDFVIETDAASGDALAKRLTLYKLRAKVAVARRADNAVTVSWDMQAQPDTWRDMRFARAGLDVYRIMAAADNRDESGYRALRIAHGISGGAEDGSAADFFPHDLMMDRNGGLNFKKGCYVGQEVVSRMQHRSTARRRLVTVRGPSPLPEGGSVTVGGREIGTLRTVAGNAGLAVIRIDKAGEAMATGVPVMVGEAVVDVSLPGWSGITFPAAADDAAS